ncbi:hypothetical protein HG536_0F04470 [Torulaspora globosa]|uniref:BED-type domain-containing protein n=1 Tax=Torulaspora globosa TaxID=48254 RepID=A0A7G3ZKT5_9SACH|nr:uncharacterized protein HG536_0F04470 [Torulaspora globosa]QLL34121.1 hypothetical protein HG536_0F04470 [Torulaspora globosa]
MSGANTHATPIVIQQDMPFTKTSSLSAPISSRSCPATPAEMIRSTPNTTLKVKKSPKKSPSRWMERSSFKIHFTLLNLNNKKRAKCIYCGKTFREGESTGNLSKHITAVHPSALKSKKPKGSNLKTLDMLPRRSKSLRLSESLVQECQKNPQALQTLLLISEGFLPFNFVRLLSWRLINQTNPANAFIQSRTTLSTKINLFKRYLNETLHCNLKDTTMVNIQLDIWTSPSNISFLAVMVSFAPNILNMESLELANDAKILLNNRGESRNCHLLEFISLGHKRHTGLNIYKVFKEILDRHNLVDKLGTITMDNATNNESFHKSLVYDYLNKIKPSGHQMLGKVRFIRCANHVLNLIFGRIIKSLSEDLLFADAFSKVTKLAKIMRRSTAVNASLKEHGIPLIPYESQTRWIYSWRQVTVFLQNYDAYSEWFKALDTKSHTHIINRVQSDIRFEEKTIQMLTYFVKCCDIFGKLNFHFQNDEFNNLPQGVPLYYLLGHYYKLCLRAFAGNHIPKTPGMDFSYFNGPESLSLDDKRIVLQAIKDSCRCYEDYLSDIQVNPLFYVAVILDPTAKQDKLYEIMEDEEFTVRISEVNSFMRNYLKVQRFSCATEQERRKIPEACSDENLLSFNIRVAPDPSRHTGSAAMEAECNDGSLEEWVRYQREPVIAGNSRQEAIKWWYDHRHTYPMLFKLAMSLFYTKFTSCDVERCFSLAGRVVRKDRARLSHNNIGTLMILRDRFSNFGFYNGGLVSDAILDDDDFDINLDDSDHEREDSDDAIFEEWPQESWSPETPTAPRTPEDSLRQATDSPTPVG